MQIILLGMHRSGTSAVSELIRLMGAYAGDEKALMPKTEANPKGYGEREDVYKFSEAFLNEAGASWYHIAEFDLGRVSTDKKDSYILKAKAVLSDLNAHQPWVIKDPRLCILFPLWRPMLDKMVCVFVYRNPIQVAQSLVARDNIPLTAGIALWEKYNLSALNAIQGIPTIIVSYQELIENPFKTCTTIYNWFIAQGTEGLTLPTESVVNDLIDVSLYRNRGNLDLLGEFLNNKQSELYSNLERKQILTKVPSLSIGAQDALYFFDKYSLLKIAHHAVLAEKKSLSDQIEKAHEIISLKQNALEEKELLIIKQNKLIKQLEHIEQTGEEISRADNISRKTDKILESAHPLDDINKHHDTAVLLHLYYFELWDEISNFLENLDGKYDLYISIPLDVNFEESEIIAKCPHANIYRCANRGRDIAPFLTTFSAINPLNYKYILKIHTKRSQQLKEGDTWRHELLSNLLGSRELVRQAKNLLDSRDNVGIVAPKGHVLPGTSFWGSNENKVKLLTQKSGIPYKGEEFQFVAGTMFWLKPSAFKPVISLHRNINNFEPEIGQIDGTLAHAYERYFGLLMQSTGYKIVEIGSSHREEKQGSSPEYKYAKSSTNKESDKGYSG